jgi:hypothetical protein
MFLFNTVLGEELLFRGYLLPRMNGAFRRGDWVANGLLFTVYHLHVPWVMPATLVESFLLAYPTKRYRSAWIGIAVHNAQSVSSRSSSSHSLSEKRCSLKTSPSPVGAARRTFALQAGAPLGALLTPLPRCAQKCACRRSEWPCCSSLVRYAAIGDHIGKINLWGD